MIYDRKIQDVERAKQIRLEKVQNFLPLTDEEKNILAKGFVGTDTLNRIEFKQISLKNTLNSMGYYNCEMTHGAWLDVDYFRSSHLKRIFENARILKDAFFSYETTPENLDAKYYLEEFNKLEKTLVDIEDMIADVTSRYKMCGTFNCGG